MLGTLVLVLLVDGAGRGGVVGFWGGVQCGSLGCVLCVCDGTWEGERRGGRWIPCGGGLGLGLAVYLFIISYHNIIWYDII